MIFIKRFIDKVSAMEGRKDLILSMDEAKGLRNELAKIMADNYEMLAANKEKTEVIKVELTGGKW